MAISSICPEANNLCNHHFELVLASLNLPAKALVALVDILHGKTVKY
jgi:hypothetical protein